MCGKALAGGVDHREENHVVTGDQEPPRPLGEEHGLGGLVDADPRTAGRHQHPLVELGAELAQDALEVGEVHHRALLADAAMGAQEDAVVVAVEALAPALVDREVGRAEPDVGAGKLEAGLHGCVP